MVVPQHSASASNVSTAFAEVTLCANVIPPQPPGSSTTVSAASSGRP
jgi:hypothetical protein